MRRFPGEWVRWQVRKRSLVGLTVVSGAFGFGLHAVFDLLLPPFLGQEWQLRLNLAAVLVSFALMLWCWRDLEWGHIAGWLKGDVAETYVGQVIEYALAAPHCAAAHSVTGLTAGGDIDHLVATPTGLRVVETKAGRVPRKRFPRVLARMAMNAKAVRDWAPPGTPVHCCLVLKDPGRTGRKDYEWEGRAGPAAHDPGVAQGTRRRGRRSADGRAGARAGGLEARHPGRAGG